MGTGTELVNQVVALYNKHDWKAVASLYTSDAVYTRGGRSAAKDLKPSVPTSKHGTSHSLTWLSSQRW